MPHLLGPFFRPRQPTIHLIPHTKPNPTQPPCRSHNPQTERALALELAQFPEALHDAVSELMPSRICSYVFGLSSRATDFLEACHVLTAPHRLVLVQATTAVIVRCLELLGIRPITKI